MLALFAIVVAQWQPLGPLVCSPQTGQGITIAGQRGPGDYAADITFDNRVSIYPRGGYRASFNVCGVMGIGFTDTGDMHFGYGRNMECQSDPGAGTLKDRSTTSGHRALEREAGYNLVVRGAEGARTDAVNSDGSAPECPGPYTRQTDAGCRYNYAGGHGDFDMGSAYPMYAGFLAEFYNPLSGVGARTDHRAYIDWNGAYVQNHQLARAQFPAAKQVKVTTNLGEFYYEQAESGCLWAFDEHREYCSDGTHWRRTATNADVDALLAAIALLSARVTALEATCP